MIAERQMDFIRRHMNDRPRARYIAESGVSPATFYRAVRELGGELRHELAVARPGIRECVEKHYPTMSAKEIAERFGYSKARVQKWAIRLGIKSSPEKVERMERERSARLARNRGKLDYAASARKRKAKWRLDEYRSWQGLPRQTRLRLKTMPYRSYQAKWYLRHAYGYGTTANPYELLVTGGTKRCRKEDYFAKKYKLSFVTERLDKNDLETN